MSDTFSVRTVIYDHLASMGGGVPIQSAYVDSPADVPRYEVSIAGEANMPFLLDGGNQHTGEIQVAAVVRNGTGEAEFGALVAAVQNHFNPLNRINGIAVIGIPEAKPPLIDGDELRVPILIRYRTILSV